MTVMPPIECPTRTTGPRGTRASSTAARSRASCSMVECSAAPRPGGAVPALVVEDQPRVGRCPLAVASSAASVRRWKAQDAIDSV